MPKMHLMTALVALAGDITNVVNRSASNPVSYPEIAVLEAVHGEGCIVEIEFHSETDTTVTAEKARLIEKYGAVVETVYPGRNPQMEFVDPTVKAAKAAKAGKGDKDKEPEKTEDAAADPFAVSGS